VRDAAASGVLARSSHRFSFAFVGRRIERRDVPAYALTLVVATSIIVTTGLLVHALWTDSRLSRHEFGWNFLWTQDWDPVQEIYGPLPYIYGTVMTSLFALAIAVPMGLGSAIFLAELAPQKISNGEK
jgi:phosphate transport system permease protein